MCVYYVLMINSLALSNGEKKRGVSTSVAETRLVRSKGRGGGEI